MKKSLLFIVVAAMIMWSCSNDDYIRNLNKDANAISFGTYVNMRNTKTTATTNSTFLSFFVNGYSSSSSINWGSIPGNLMSAMVSRANTTTDTNWTTIPVPWPAAGKNLMFYAYAPTNSSNITYSASATTGPKLTVKNLNQPDILVAKTGNIVALASGSNGRILMSFSHIMSKIDITAKVMSGLTAYILSADIQGLDQNGTYTFNDGLWSGLSSDSQHSGGINTTYITTGLSATTSTLISSSDGSIIAIPQSKAAWNTSGAFDGTTQTRLVITFKLQNNADNSYILGSAGAWETAYVPIALTLEKSKSYTIDITFGDGSSSSGGGGYDSSGNPLLNKSYLIQLSTNYTDWTVNGSTAAPM